MIVDNGYYKWNKGDLEKLSNNFATNEFECQCSYKSCVEQRISVKLIEGLQKVRDEADCALIVTSGFRCTRHQDDLTQNPHIQTVKLSQHELGNAVDIRPSALGGIQLNRVLWIAAKSFDSIGIADRWFHLDTRPGYRRWRYV